MLCTTKSVLATKSHNILSYCINLICASEKKFYFLLLTDAWSLHSHTHHGKHCMYETPTTQLKPKSRRGWPEWGYIYIVNQIHYTVIDSDQLS